MIDIIKQLAQRGEYALASEVLAAHKTCAQDVSDQKQNQLMALERQEEALLEAIEKSTTAEDTDRISNELIETRKRIESLSGDISKPYRITPPPGVTPPYMISK